MAADNLKLFRLQLMDLRTGKIIQTSGGKCYVAQDGVATKQAVKDSNGAAATNPVSLDNGQIEFYTLNTVDKVDLYIQCPGGQFAVFTGIVASGPNELGVDTGNRFQMMVIPWAQADFTANTETETGFTEPSNAVFMADSTGAGIRVVTVDATETIDVGTLSTDSGDADGFISAASIATAGIVLDNGALLTTLVGHISGGKSITITTSAGSDTGVGFIYLPYKLMN